MARGRPRKVDPDAALETAITVFWEKGYEGTSMSDLVAATGVAKPGLYAAFGDKESLFAKALEHYVDRGWPLLEDLAQSADPIDVVLRRFLCGIAAAATDKKAPGGCFLVNSLVECANQTGPLEDLTRTIEKKRQAVLLKRLRAAIKGGELADNADAKALADFFTGQSLALAVMGRAGANTETLDRVIDLAMRALPSGNSLQGNNGS